MKHQCPAARCTLRSLSRAKAMAKGGVTQNAPAEGEADEGWGHKPTQWGKTLGDLKADKLAKANPVLGNKAFFDTKLPVTLLVMPTTPNAPDIAALKIDFFGQRPGLIDLPHISVVELTGHEFGEGLNHSQLMKKANDHLRALQKESGLHNPDTGWLLRINKLGRKKMGDNKEQSLIELSAVAGIE